VDAAPSHAHKASVQPFLRTIGDGDDVRGLPLATLAQRLTRHRAMAGATRGYQSDSSSKRPTLFLIRLEQHQNQAATHSGGRKGRNCALT
jgi:hypothetical protein